MVIFFQEEHEIINANCMCQKQWKNEQKGLVSKETGELLNLLNHAIIIPSPP